MPEFRGSVLDDSGAAVADGSTVDIYDIDTTTPSRASTTTSSGNWSISHATRGQFDVKIVVGSDVVWLRARDRLQVSRVEAWESAANMEALVASRTEDVASLEVATFEGDRATPTDADSAYISLKHSDSAGGQTEVARLEWIITDVTDTTEDGDFVIHTMAAGTLAERVRFLSSGEVAIGLAGTAPDGTVHIHQASAGSVTATTVADALVIENSAATGISILTPNTSNADIQFGDPDDNDAGRVRYDHNTGQMQFFVEGSARQVIGTANSQFTVYLKRLTTAGITASVTQTQGQGALTSEINEVATVANTNDTVTLPSAVAGYKITVINNGANTLQIFPASGDNLGAGLNTATTLAAGSNVVYVAYDATNWESV